MNRQKFVRISEHLCLLLSCKNISPLEAYGEPEVSNISEPRIRLPGRRGTLCIITIPCASFLRDLGQNGVRQSVQGRETPSTGKRQNTDRRRGRIGRSPAGHTMRVSQLIQYSKPNISRVSFRNERRENVQYTGEALLEHDYVQVHMVCRTTYKLRLALDYLARLPREETE